MQRRNEGERLEDMVESIREHGVLNPVIVWQEGEGYEMLSGHNRQMAGKLAGLAEIPAIVKTDLTEEEAYVYVIETNVIQRGFAELLPSEKAAVLAERYEKVSSQGRRNDILEEIARLNGQDTAGTCGHDVHKLKLYFASPNIPNANVFLQLFEKSIDEQMIIKESPVAQNRFFIDYVEGKGRMFTETGEDIIFQDLGKKEQDYVGKLLRKLGKNCKNAAFRNMWRRQGGLHGSRRNILQALLEMMCSSVRLCPGLPIRIFHIPILEKRIMRRPCLTGAGRRRKGDVLPVFSE